MPIYEYRCSKCGKTFEALQSIAAQPIAKCLYCQGKTNKIISLSSFQLKGEGWYITDYKNNTGKEIKKEKSAKIGNNKTDNAKIN